MENSYDLELETKPDFAQCMKRVYAWYEGEMIDRVPIRFSGYDEAFFREGEESGSLNQRERWFDTEYRVGHYLSSIRGKIFHAETFPVFWPNLGPNVFAAMLGAEMEFGDTTSWIHPFIFCPGDIQKVFLNKNGLYYQKIVEMTRYAIDEGEGQCLVGYTDMHPGLDCVDALLGTEAACLGMYDDPDFIQSLLDRISPFFFDAMDDFHALLKDGNQLSVTWLNVPSYQTMHIPSCDLSSMLSPRSFEEFALPGIRKEVEKFQHTIFHIDGKGVARHLDALLELDKIRCFQWVQGVGDDKPIMQWIDLIKKIQNRGKGVMVSLRSDELDAFMSAISPKGIFLCMDESKEETQLEIIDALLRWR